MFYRYFLIIYPLGYGKKRKKNRSSKNSCFYYPKITNYAATAGATRATGRDSPAARSRGKL